MYRYSDLQKLKKDSMKM